MKDHRRPKLKRSATELRHLEPPACETCHQSPCLCDIDDPDRDEDNCFHCGGEGYDECVAPLECTNHHTPGGLCRCSSCGGTGLAKDMTSW